VNSSKKIKCKSELNAEESTAIVVAFATIHTWRNTYSSNIASKEISSKTDFLACCISSNV